METSGGFCKKVKSVTKIREAGAVMKEYLEEILQDIRGKTAGMAKQDKWSYILTYYWHYFLGVFAALFLLGFLIVHFGFGEERPAFTCVLVNQEINAKRDRALAEQFADQVNLDADRIVFDSDYNLSYGDVHLEGINESSFEKFFLKWQNDELDAVILPESFYEYCKEAGGSFLNLEQWDAGELPFYQDTESGETTAVLVEQTELSSYIKNETGERLLLAFPSNGQHEDLCRELVSDLNTSKKVSGRENLSGK